jgi:hypothetical protein
MLVLDSQKPVKLTKQATAVGHSSRPRLPSEVRNFSIPVNTMIFRQELHEHTLGDDSNVLPILVFELHTEDVSAWRMHRMMKSNRPKNPKVHGIRQHAIHIFEDQRKAEDERTADIFSTVKNS